jgi:hypothetical protein
LIFLPCIWNKSKNALTLRTLLLNMHLYDFFLRFRIMF